MVRVEEKSSFRTTEMRCWLGVSFSPLGENQEMSLYLASPATRDNNKKKKQIGMSSHANIQGIKDNQEHYVEDGTKEGLIVPEKQAKKIILHRCEWSAAVLQKWY